MAFSIVLAASLLAPAYQLLAMQRMEATFDAMEDHERSMFLALQIEDAVHTQYEQGARFLLDRDPSRIADIENARAQALAITHVLTARMPEADAAAWEAQIDDGTTELGRLLRDEPRQPSGAPTTLAHDRSYGIVLLIEKSIHEYYGKLQRAMSDARKELVQMEQAVLRWTALLVAATTALGASMVLYVSRSVARPLARLSEGASAVASGDLDSRIDVDTNDEFGVVATEFNAMTTALKQHQERSVESEKLAGIGRVAAGVAHELNNPLQVMLGYLALNRDVADPALACQLAAIEEEALRCKTIIDGMLELSRPATQAAATVDLRELCDDVCAGLRVAAQPHVPLMIIQGAAQATGDRARLRQAVFNLMKNAVEAAGPEGQVRVSLALDGDLAEVAVSDTGPGLAPDARTRIFEPFFTTKQEGTGLGLAVSRAVARAHGGDIEVRNAEGAGAVFTLRLPSVREARS